MMIRVITRFIILLALVGSLNAHPAVASDPAAPAAPRADWYSPSFHSAVLTAGSEGLPLPEGAPVPTSSIAFPGIRPGAWLISPNWCTLNFIFNTSGTLSGGPYYAGSAKHCVQRQFSAAEGGGWDTNEDPVGKPAVAVIALSAGSLPRVIKIGTVSHVTAGNHSIGNDFALIQIDPTLSGYISPSIAEIGGPTTTTGGDGAAGDLLGFSGHGAGIGTAGTPRTGLLTIPTSSTPNAFGAILAATPGDSGGPVRSLGGDAIGNLTHIAPTLEGARPAIVYGTKVGVVTQRWGLKVVTCPSAIPWPSLGCPS